MVVRERQIFETAVDAHACVVHPGVEPAETSNRSVGRRLHRLGVADIGDRIGRFSSTSSNPFTQGGQARFIARQEHELRALSRRLSRYGEPVARCRPGDDERLFPQGLQLQRHGKANR